MKCTYTYKGHVFDSELKLDDFLIGKKKYEKKYGDEVFSRGTEFMHTESILDDIRVQAKASDAAYEEARRKAIDMADGETAYVFNPPRIGVNAWVAGRPDPDDPSTLLTPEFRQDEYWDRKKYRWTHMPEPGKTWLDYFTEDDLTMWFKPDDPTASPKEQMEQRKAKCAAMTRPLTAEEANKLERLIKAKWHFQNTTGTAVHFIMQKYFSKITLNVGGETKEVNVRDLGSRGLEPHGTKGDPDYIPSIDDYMLEAMDTELRAQMGRDYRENILDRNTVHNLIQFGDRLANHIQSVLGDTDLEFHPEFRIVGDSHLVSPGEPKQLLGSIDLLVTDSKGNTHIFDYKTSPKAYNDYNSAKKRAFYFQLAVYAKLLRQHGISYSDSKIRIIPIQLKGLTLDNQDEAIMNPDTAKFSFESLDFSPTISEDIYDDIMTLHRGGTRSIMNELDDYFPDPVSHDVESDDFLQQLQERMRKRFPNYRVRRDMLSDEEVKSIIEEAGGFERDKDSGKYSYRPPGTNSPAITADTEVELMEKVKKSIERSQHNIDWVVSKTIDALKAGQNGDSIDDIIRPFNTRNTGDKALQSWFKDTLGRYCNEDWTVVDNNQLSKVGVILLRNTQHPKQLRVLTVTSQLTHYNRHYGGHKNRDLIGACFETDMQEQSNPDSLMMEGVSGNILLIETLHALNQMPSLFDDGTKIDNIQVINPFTGKGITAPNEDLLYTYKKLTQLSGDEFQDNITDKNILCTTVESAKYALDDILDSSINVRGINKVSEALSARADWDTLQPQDVDQKIKLIDNLVFNLEQKYNISQINRSSLEGQDWQLADLYNKLLIASSELKGIHFKQQIRESDKYLANGLDKILKKGVTGLWIDNPGNLTSSTLNQLSNITNQAYQNLRNSMAKVVAESRTKVEKLKESSGYNVVTRQVMNPTSMYKGMIYLDPQHDLRFANVNSPNLTEAQRDFLKYALRIINKNRHPNWTEAEMDRKERSDSIDYYECPLARADTESQFYLRGATGGFIERLKAWNPKTALQEMRAKAEGAFNEDDNSYETSQQLFQLSTMFDRGEPGSSNYNTKQTRLDLIDQKGEAYFEHNLELLLYKHVFAYNMKTELSKVMPTAKAAIASLVMQGQSQNTSFDNDVEYAEAYIKNKMKNQPIQNEDQEGMKKATAVSAKIRSLASFFALAFSPVQGLYQTIQGFWNDISLIIRKPDGTQAFTLKNMLHAAKIVYSDMLHYSDKPTKCQLINEMYGINDMDINTYAERMRSDKHGIWNLNDLAFKFTSRPDYYNRMIIVVSRMLADGSWDALDVKDNKLVYDWKKDKRFAAYANNQIGSPDYDKAHAMYIAVADQFAKENAVNEDGSQFKFGDPLPYAYTNKEMSSIKNLCDTIYGYYSHENKSMVHATFLGALWMQMKTYWSGKKNQYLQPGGTRIQGNWEIVKDENGNTLCYQVNDDGTINYDLPPVLESELDPSKPHIPVVQWKGRWQEGIILTLGNMLRDDNGNLSLSNISRLNPLHSRDEQVIKIMNDLNVSKDVAEVYTANLRQAYYDVIAFGIISLLLGGMMAGWAKDLEKEAKESNLASDAAKATAALITSKSIVNSGLDFAWWDSIGNPVLSWSAFGPETVWREGKNLWNTIFGDKDIVQGFVGAFSAAKQFRPLINYEFRNDSE